MTYPAIPIILFVLLIGYLLWLLLYKKDMIKFKQMSGIGLFFAGIWAVIYYFLF